MDEELFPCLRKFGISFYAYNPREHISTFSYDPIYEFNDGPVAAGFFTSRSILSSNKGEVDSHFNSDKAQGQHYQRRYWNEHYFAALVGVNAVTKTHGLTLAETALRWLSHHSSMRRERGDSVLIGASSTDHIEQVKMIPDLYIRTIQKSLTVLYRIFLTLRKAFFASPFSFDLHHRHSDPVFLFIADDVVAALDKAWTSVRAHATNYHH